MRLFFQAVNSFYMHHLNNCVPADIYLCLQPQAARAKWSPDVWLLLGRRRRQWPDITRALGRCFLFFAFRKRTTKHLLLVYRTSPLNPYSSEIYICEPWRTKVFFNLKTSYLFAFSASLEYLCCGSTAIINIFTHTVRGLTESDVLQTSDSDV